MNHDEESILSEARERALTDVRDSELSGVEADTLYERQIEFHYTRLIA